MGHTNKCVFSHDRLDLCNHFINSISVKHALHFYVEDFDSCVQDTYKVGKLT